MTRKKSSKHFFECQKALTNIDEKNVFDQHTRMVRCIYYFIDH